MKIILVGDLNSYTRTAQRRRAFEDLGHEIIPISTSRPSDVPGLGRGPSLLERIMWKLGLPIDTTSANRQLLEAAASGPEIVWIDKALTIRPGTLARVRQVSPWSVLVSFSEDPMSLRHNRSLYYTWSIDSYDFLFTPNPIDVEHMPRLGAKRIVLVDKSFDRYTHRPLPLSQEDYHRWGSDVSFVGTFEKDRAMCLSSLAQHGLAIRVWGNNWRSWQKRHPELHVEGRPVYFDNYPAVICASKVNLCFLRKANRDTSTSRSVEIPACGSFMLGERTYDHQRLFVEGKEAEFFSSQAELVEKVQFYLKHDDLRKAIGQAGRMRCLSSGYSHQDRVQYMLGHIRGVTPTL